MLPVGISQWENQEQSAGWEQREARGFFSAPLCLAMAVPSPFPGPFPSSAVSLGVSSSWLVPRTPPLLHKYPPHSDTDFSYLWGRLLSW